MVVVGWLFDLVVRRTECLGKGGTEGASESVSVARLGMDGHGRVKDVKHVYCGNILENLSLDLCVLNIKKKNL